MLTIDPKTERLVEERRAARETRLRIILRSLKQKAAEQQDAEDDYNRDNDEFNQRHCHASELPQVYLRRLGLSIEL